MRPFPQSLNKRAIRFDCLFADESLVPTLYSPNRYVRLASIGSASARGHLYRARVSFPTGGFGCFGSN